MNKLTREDLHLTVLHIPKDVQKEMMKTKQQLFVGGGFVRAAISGEDISDIDMFGKSKESLQAISDRLYSLREGSRKLTTDNAITVLTHPRKPLQFITRWLFSKPKDLIDSFDFTVCQAVVWYSSGKWRSMISDRFYSDLAAKRLIYTSPVRDEEAGGSMLRMRKYISRGYNIQPESMGRILARLVVGIKKYSVDIHDEKAVGYVLSGMLREVDPLMIVDGCELIADHEAMRGLNFDDGEVKG